MLGSLSQFALATTLSDRFSLERLVRPHILRLAPYSSARDEYTGSEGVFLDANENPIGSAIDRPLNRYPDPYQRLLKEKLAILKGTMPEQIFLGNGSDEAIDLLFRAFCHPDRDNVILMPPTYGMYEVSAAINCVEARAVPLSAEFQIRTEAVLQAMDERTKIAFICSPNNPTGNDLHPDAIARIATECPGLVVIDEAYIDFAARPSYIAQLERYPNLVVLQTFSKAWGLAALRLGMAFAAPEIIAILNKIKPPYNISAITQQLAIASLARAPYKEAMVAEILQQREGLAQSLRSLPCVRRVYPSDANFLLVQVTAAKAIYEYLVASKIIVRDRSRVVLCEECLRITVGTAAENQQLLAALSGFEATSSRDSQP